MKHTWATINEQNDQQCSTCGIITFQFDNPDVYTEDCPGRVE